MGEPTADADEVLFSCRLRTETVGTTGLEVGLEGGVGIGDMRRVVLGAGRPGIPKPKALQESVETTVAVTGTEVTV